MGLIECCLFIGCFSKLYNGNKYDSKPIGDSTTMKEEYEIITLVLKHIKYEEQYDVCRSRNGKLSPRVTKCNFFMPLGQQG